MLVIIGLLAGGVLVGRDMIRAAELRSIAKEYEAYITAVHVFKQKYMALPGDMNNATRFWGEMGDGGTGACPSTAGTGTETCDGDGSGLIHVLNYLSYGHEHFLFWQHLANAGLINGTYTGVSGSIIPPGGRDAVVGVNSPRTRYGGAATWMPVSFCTGSTYCWNGGVAYNQNVMYFGAQNSPDGVEMSEWVLKPIDAKSIDTKIDDGRPGTGILVTRGIVMCAFVPPAGLATTTSDDTAEYDVNNVITSTNPTDARYPDACNLVFMTPF